MKKILFVLFFGLLVACSAERLAIKDKKKEIYNNLDANEDTAFGDTIIDFDSSYTNIYTNRASIPKYYQTQNEYSNLLCDNVEGIKVTQKEFTSYVWENSKLVPDDYTGLVKKCVATDETEKVKIVMHFKNGKEDGLRKNWHDNGQLMYEYNYREGKQEGLQKQWHRNGQLWAEFNCREGKKDGLWKEWNQFGQLMKTKKFKKGELKYEKCWNEDGHEIECD